MKVMELVNQLRSDAKRMKELREAASKHGLVKIQLIEFKQLSHRLSNLNDAS
ncbi:hypothetical protein H0N95_01430, partial [Candidatus Micrarchaeota archaeon]|nr:hypothetical protein [Candidatus Micrarchaeota archaeon]